METPFFGGTYQSLSPNLADNRCMNLIPEIVETKDGKQIGGFYSTPGQKNLLTLSNSGSGAVAGPLRGLRAAANKKLIAVFGNQVVQIDINNNVTALGYLNTASGPVSIIDNGSQYAVFDGFQGWYWSSGTWARITTIPNFSWVATIQDEFGIVGIWGTNQFYQSNLNDLSTWDALNFSSADSEPSNIQAIVTLFRQLWVVKERSIEIWNNAGLNGFAFQRMEGAFINVGCAAPFSVATSEDRVFWLGQSDKGSLQVYINNGYSEQRISTHAVEYQISSYLQLSSIGIADAIGFCYTQAGHVYYVLTFPSGNATWVYDLTTGLWHERGEFIDGSYNRWDPSCYAFFNKQHVVGSSTSQRLSVLDMLYATDDLATTPPSNPKRWMRRWRALKQPINAPVRFGSLKIDMQTGSLPYASNIPYRIDGTLGNGRSGIPASLQYSLVNGINPVRYAIVGGAIPAGLSMSSSGLITGTRTTQGTYNWSVQAIDVYGNGTSRSDTSQTLAPYAWTWIPQTQLPTTQSRISPPYPDPSSGIFISTDDSTGGVYLSSNGGATWSSKSTGLSGSDSVFCAGASQGTILAFSDNSAKTARSTDGGNTWSILTNSGIIVDQAIYTPACVFIYGFGGGAAYSVDGGQTWSIPSVPSGFNVGDSILPFAGLYISSWNVWVAPGQNAIYESVGVGANNAPTVWTTPISSTDRVGTVAYSPTLDIAVVGAQSGIYYRTRSGSWTYVNNFGGSAGNGVCWCPTLSLFVCISSTGGGLWASPDGINWSTPPGATHPGGGMLVWSPVANQMFLSNNLASGSPPYLSNI
jgi:hypothetical protein